MTVLLQCSLDSDSEISLKIGDYLMKLRRMKLRRTKQCASFWATLYINIIKGWLKLLHEVFFYFHSVYSG